MNQGLLTTGNSGWCSLFRPRLTSLDNSFIQSEFTRFTNMVAPIIITFLLGLLQAKLYHVVAVISPGARYPINDFHDGNDTRAKWGELSSVGLRQQESLGKLLRKNYISNSGLLSTSFVKEEFQLISMTLNRTIQSALANLHGMYGLGNGQKLNPADKKYRIPPYSMKQDISEDYFSLPQGQLIQTVSFSSSLLQECPNAAKQAEKNIRLQMSDYNQMVLSYAPFLKKMASTFGIEPNSMNFTKISGLYDTIRADRYLGRGLPRGLSQQDFENMEHLYNWYSQFTCSFDLAKAYNTYKINEILASFDTKVKNPNAQAKWITIAADQIDMVSLQNGLNITSASCVEQIYRRGTTTALNCEIGTPFASSLIFELHSDNAADFSVRIRNNGRYVNLCGLRQSTCSYNVWKALTKAATVPDPVVVCGKSQSVEPVIVLQ